MNKLLYGLLICYSCTNSIFNAAKAQTTKADPVDVQGWYGASVQARVTDNWKIALEGQLRFFNNLKTFNGTYISLGVERKVNDYLALQGEYRLALVQKGVYHRLSAGGTFTYEWEKPAFEFRILVQNQLQDFDEVGKLSQREFYARTRFRLKYPLTAYMDFYLSTEPVFKVNGRHLIDNLRNQVGLRFPIAPSLKAQLYYIYRPDYAKSYRRTFHTIGMEIIYGWKKRKRLY